MGATRQAAQREQRGRREARESGSSSGGSSRTGSGKSSTDGQSADESAAAQAESRPELTDATQYDFDRLERAISGLVAQQHVLQRDNEALRGRLGERDRDIERLQTDLEGALERRKDALNRVDALIDELDRLDARLDEAMVDWVEGADQASPKRRTPTSPAG